MPGARPIIDFDQLFETTIGRIKFGSGVIGKTGTVMLGVVIVFGIVAYRIDGFWALAGIALLTAAVFLVYLFATLRFAERNPNIAVLEGAELIQAKRLDLGASEMPALPDQTVGPNPLTVGVEEE